MIKYLSNEAAAQARQLLDNRDLDGFCLQVTEKTQLLILLILLMNCFGLNWFSFSLLIVLLRLTG